nr:MAG TPA: holin [Caudoviricetes sp.]
MLKNCVLRVSVDTRRWVKAAGIRALKTMAQAAIAGIGAAAAMGQVDWKYVASASLLAGVLSMLMSITGIPEVESEEE